MRYAALSLIVLSVACGSAEHDEGDSLFVEGIALDEQAADGTAYRVELSAPANLSAGKAATLTLHVKDGAGRAVTALDVEHTKKYHLIIVSRDLFYFAHVHPTQGSTGTFTYRWTPPAFDDQYYLFSQFAPAGKTTSTVLNTLHVPGLSLKSPVPLTEELTQKTSGRTATRIILPTGGARVGTNKIRFAVTEQSSGAAATNIGTFLGARAHLIAVLGNAEGRVFRHAHQMAMADDGSMAGMAGHEGHAGMTAPAAGSLELSLSLPRAGLYKVWAQFRRGTTDVTAPFVIRVR